MGQLLLFLVIGLTAGAIVFGVAALVTGNAPGLAATEPDGRAVPLPTHRPLAESDLDQVRFDTSLRGYRMAQVDQALRRAAYDIGYKDELIGVLEAEVAALREGRTDDADALCRVREAALTPVVPAGANSAAGPTAAPPATATSATASTSATAGTSGTAGASGIDSGAATAGASGGDGSMHRPGSPETPHIEIDLEAGDQRSDSSDSAGAPVRSERP